MTIRLGIALLAACIVAGCQNQTAVSNAGKEGSQGTAGASEPQKLPLPGEPQKQVPPVPDDLKTEAYHWYGLDNLKSMKIIVEITGKPPQSGEQTVKLTDVKDGKAIYEIERPGELGTETISLEKDGIYTIGSTLIQGATRNLELPSDLPPGKTWKNTGKVQMSQEVEQNLTIKVIGVSDVDTKAGKQSALHVKQTGVLSFGGTKYRMDSDLYYVKDKGLVKSVATLNNVSKPKEKPQVITIQETK
jgi:hypothetical protein